jgi:hypothetical protein
MEMVMRVVVADARNATMLARRSAVDFGAERVRLWRDRPEVEVELMQSADRALLRLPEAVERWLDGAAVAFAELWVGGRSNKLARRAPIASAP